MKQQTLERARSTVEAFLHQQDADTTLSMLSVNPEVDGYGDEFLLIHLTYDDGNDAKGLPGSLARIRLTGRLRTELQVVDVEAFPVVSFTAESEVEEEPEQRVVEPEHLLQIAVGPAEANSRRPQRVWRADLCRTVNTTYSHPETLPGDGAMNQAFCRAARASVISPVVDRNPREDRVKWPLDAS